MSPYVVRTDVPFLAVRREREGGPFDDTNAVYLVNPLEVALTNVHVSTGGFFSMEHEVVEAKGKPRPTFDVPPRSFVRIEMTSDEEFYDFVVWWEIGYEAGGKSVKAAHNVVKGRDWQEVDDVPVLGGPGRLVTQKAQDPSL